VLAFVVNGRLFTAPVVGGAPTRLSRPREHLESPTWSPDGRWIACERLTLTKYTQLVTNTQLVVLGAWRHIEHTLTREPPGTFFAANRPGRTTVARS
jgi:Tol biopolymer transport system component